MFSFQKILVLIGVLSAVWAAFRFISQIQAAQQKRERLAKKDQRRSETSERKRTTKNTTEKAMDLSACPKCGAFVPNGQHDC